MRWAVTEGRDGGWVTWVHKTSRIIVRIGDERKTRNKEIKVSLNDRN